MTTKTDWKKLPINTHEEILLAEEAMFAEFHEECLRIKELIEFEGVIN